MVNLPCSRARHRRRQRPASADSVLPCHSCLQVVERIAQLAFRFHPPSHPLKFDAVSLRGVIADAARYPAQEGVIAEPDSHLLHPRSGFQCAAVSVEERMDVFEDVNPAAMMNAIILLYWDYYQEIVRRWKYCGC